MEKVWGKPEKSLRFRFKYGVWRDDFINYIIVKEHENIKQNPHWRNGVVLEYTYDNRVNKIKVESFRREKYIDLEIVGEADLRYTLEHFRKGVMPYVHEMFTNIEPSEWFVYKEVEISYKVLKTHLEKGWKEYRCTELEEELSVAMLMGYVDLPKEEATKRLIDRLLQEGNEEEIVALLRKGELSKEMVINIISVSGNNNVIGQYLKESGFMIGERGEKAFHSQKTKPLEAELSNFQSMLNRILAEKQKEAIPDILSKIKESEYHYNKVLFADIENSMGVISQSLQAQNLVNSTKTLINSLTISLL